MEKVELSEGIVEATLARGFALSRDEFRKIKAFNRQQMTRYVVEIYKRGFEDGLDAVQKAVEDTRAKAAGPVEQDAEEVKVDWEDVLSVIATVKGVSADLLQDIDRTLKEAY